MAGAAVALAGAERAFFRAGADALGGGGGGGGGGVGAGGGAGAGGGGGLVSQGWNPFGPAPQAPPFVPLGAAQAPPTTTTTATAAAFPGGIIPAAPTPAAREDRVRAVHAYAPASPDELPLRVGDIVAVTARHDDGWAHGTTAGGRSGAFPLNYVTPAE